MNESKPVPINLRILEKDYVIACPEEEKATLLASANYLNEKVREVKERNKASSTERIVVVSALNIIHEYFQYKKDKEGVTTHFDKKVLSLKDKITLALQDIKEYD